MSPKGSLLVALVCATFAGCGEKGSDEKPKEPLPPELSSSLWRFAPPDAVFGMVAPDGAFASIFDAGSEVERVLARVGADRPLINVLKMRLGGSFDPFERDAYAAIGLSLERGGAVFFDPQMRPLVVLPVADRTRFREFTEAKTEKIGDIEFEHLSDGAYCREADGRYLCAERASSVDRALSGTVTPLAAKWLSLGSKAKGQFEVLALLEQMPTFGSELQAVRKLLPGVATALVTAELDGGRLSFTAWVDAKPPFAAPKATLAAGGTAPVAFYKMQLPLQALLGALPDEIQVGDVDVRKALFEELTGEMSIELRSATSPGFSLSFTVGMKSTKGLVSHTRELCAAIEALESVTAKPIKSECSLELDLKSIGGPGLAGIIDALPGTISVSKNALVLELGGEPSNANVGAPSGTLSKNMKGDSWLLASWFRVADPLASKRGLAGQIHQQIEAVSSPERRSQLSVARLLLAHVYELALGLRADGDGTTLAFEITTMAAAPKEAYQEYSKLVADSLMSGEEYSEALSKLGGKYPGTLVEWQARAAEHGAPTGGLFAMLGVAMTSARVAKYREISMSSEAPFQMQRIADALRRYHTDTGNLPPSTVMTPEPGACCKTGGKCVPQVRPWLTKGWQQLLFDIREPHYYSYQFKRKGKKKFEIRAVGDLDCDDEFSTYTLSGRVKKKRKLSFGDIEKKNPLE